MAFQSARATRYEVHTAPATGAVTGIFIAGLVTDDAIPETKCGDYWIVGAELAALPPADPATADTPADPRFQAIQATIARFLVRLHAQWLAEIAARPVVSARTPDEIAALPVLTTLPVIPADAPPSPSAAVTFPRPIPPQDAAR